MPRQNSIIAGVTVSEGAVNVRDSGALNGTSPTILAGASLELQADGIADSSGLAGPFNLYFPASVSFTLAGSGLNNEGALYNMSGVNKIEGSVSLGSNTSIGVAPDPDPMNIQLAEPVDN